MIVNKPKSNLSIENIATIFDDKKGFKGKALDMYEHTINRFPELQPFMPRPVFRDMRDAKPLQIADIIAYETHKEFKEQLKGAKRQKKRWGFEQLENLLSKKIIGDVFVFGGIFSPIAFYSQYELAKISVAISKHLGNIKE
jgi:hypothetical protein